MCLRSGWSGGDVGGRVGGGGRLACDDGSARALGHVGACRLGGAGVGGGWLGRDGSGWLHHGGGGWSDHGVGHHGVRRSQNGGGWLGNDGLSSTGGSQSSDFSILLGDVPLDSVVLHQQKGNLSLGLSDEVSEVRVQRVEDSSTSSDLFSLDDLNLLDWLLDILNLTRFNTNCWLVSGQVELVSLNLGARAVELAASDVRCIEVVVEALVESLVERGSWSLSSESSLA